MNGPEILIPLVLGTLGILTVLIPIAGLTARFALKPIVEAIARMREVQAGATGRELNLLEQRVSLLEQQYQTLDHTVERIAEIKDFDRQLTTGENRG
jgi:sensor histidine kinase YesM